MTDDHSKPASDGKVCMIFRRNPRVVATACLGCGDSLIVCHATVEYESRRCCEVCRHVEPCAARDITYVSAEVWDDIHSDDE